MYIMGNVCMYIWEMYICMYVCDGECMCVCIIVGNVCVYIYIIMGNVHMCVPDG